MKSDFTNEAFALFYLSQIPGLGSHLISQLLKQYTKPSAIILSQAHKLIARLAEDYNFWIAAQKNFVPYQNCLTILDENYPPLLKQIYDPPLFLFHRGNLKLLSSPYLLTMVGSRQVTYYHQQSLREIISKLRNTPLILVSGLALGTDALVHQEALNNSLPTIAVLGSGLADQVIYPKTNYQLSQQILANGGLLLSEYPPNAKAEIYNFPQRNRILAGLSRATVIISGTAKSGTLITAQLALEEGRSVYALPGNIDLELSQGANLLIKQGANILLEAEDIQQEYGLI